MTAPLTPQDVLAFWRAAGPKKWFEKDTAFDASIRAQFLRAHEDAAAGHLDSWAATADGSLALLILLDQFPRNMFRDSARAFATDTKACVIAAKAIDNGFDQAVAGDLKSFFYMPFMHAEVLSEQHRCVDLFRKAENTDGAKWAQLHADIIARFGRFPHRNRMLGRNTTKEEQDFLDSGGFSG